MTTHSSVLSWRIPGTEEPGRLLSMGSQGARQDRRGLARTCHLGGSAEMESISSPWGVSILQERK